MKVNVTMSMTRKEKKVLKGVLYAFMVLGFVGLLIEPYGTWKERLLSAGINLICMAVIIGGVYVADWLIAQPTRKENRKSELR